MINIVVILEIRDTDAFNRFESQAIAILRSHGGELITAFEADQSESQQSTEIEVHHIQFPSTEQFDSYRNDPALLALAELRENAIISTRLYRSRKTKHYERLSPVGRNNKTPQ